MIRLIRALSERCTPNPHVVHTHCTVQFSKEDIAYAVMAITENASRANAYLGITDKEARTKYLLCMVPLLNRNVANESGLFQLDIGSKYAEIHKTLQCFGSRL